MARIESVDGGYPFKKSEKKKTAKKEVQAARTFESIIGLHSTDETEQVESFTEIAESSDLSTLIDEVHDAGEKLKDSASLDNIRNYKKSVKSFLRYVIRNMMDVDEKTSGTNILKKKRFTLVRVIDEKLERLVAAILRGQSEQLNILERIEEINGLIVDIIS